MAGIPWKDKEVDALRQLGELGYTAVEISQVIGRSVASIQNKAYDSQISLGQGSLEAPFNEEKFKEMLKRGTSGNKGI